MCSRIRLIRGVTFVSLITQSAQRRKLTVIMSTYFLILDMSSGPGFMQIDEKKTNILRVFLKTSHTESLMCYGAYNRARILMGISLCQMSRPLFFTFVVSASKTYHVEYSSLSFFS